MTGGTVVAVEENAARVRLAAPVCDEPYPGGPACQPVERPVKYTAGLRQLEPAPAIE